ncbi:RES family NAD+ phosphorylase [Tenacibaculum finnmarkense]|uniref:HEPN-associated N-terminal domain-containing protein n=1 Tax=Tenacibaculum finnmarkense TaxID=2781243 RepID=UPI001EFBFE65|nr:HEPN-associated N-terminal domain-containing protein [Tenacibaculum finnmarkense]MCG8806503.1 RES family NAD+ phosphorylase [Tenacibaculum finnmarkense]MCG8857651.1 RES family NAD+ phosphorylase [Tenacibaculum finnmarkense]
MPNRNIKPGDDVDYELYDLDTTELVCSQHIKDDYIKKFIQKNGTKGKCDYCDKNINVIELHKVLELIITGIDYLYEDPVNSRYLNKDGLHGFDGNTFDFYDLWYEDYLDLRIENTNLFEDIFKYLENNSLYCNIDEYGSETDFLNDSWSHFNRIVKYKARFVFHFSDIFSNHNLVDPISILDKVQNSIIKFNLITELKENSILYRCRQHTTENEVNLAKHLASTPLNFSKANGRMNPAGISMFYCSKSKDLTIKEVVDSTNKSKPFYTTGIFRNKEKLNLVDLTNLPFAGSIFDSSENIDIDTITFLNGFLKDITKPIDEADSIIEYIPTQIVTEYIRFNPNLNVDGIIYPSSKDNSLKNIVIFYDHDESIDNLDFSKSSLKTESI